MIKLLSAVNKIILICLIVSISAGAAVGGGFYDSGEDRDFAERKYAPDRKVDILHIKIDIIPDFKQRTIEGITTIKFAPIAKPLDELKLDAYDLLVSSVESSAQIAGYDVTEDGITITFASAIEPDKETTVTIAYHAEPEDGFFFRTPELGYKAEDIHLFTQGESHSHRYWFPNYDFPNEHSTSEVICHVPSDMTVLANGQLVSEVINHDTGLKAVCWKQENPHVNYLVALVAGKFEKVESKHKYIPLAFYTTPSNIEYAQNSFRETADIMDFYEKEIGVDFPWCKYYQVCVADFVAGGMENTSLTILTERTLFSDDFENVRSSRMLNSHEMAHQWFGDYVTCKDWSHLWLNEGFATYYEKLHDGHQNGRDQMLYNLYNTAAPILRRTEEQRPIVYKEYSDEGEQFDYRNYNKGCWVLHMLRNRLGEDLYRKCIKTYLERFAFESAVTEDLISVIEELSGRSYDRFFDEWVRQGRFPELKISYSWSEKDKLAKVSITQTQEPVNNVSIYHFPATIRFVVNGQKIDKQIEVDSKEHDFYFPLPAKPEIVRFDPEYTLLAKIEFDKPREMLYAQLADTNDVIGRILAIEQLEEKKDKTTIEKLKHALNNDEFYGVRIKACDALIEMKDEDAACEALCNSIEQPDARVRRSVLGGIGSVYGEESHQLILDVIETEKNPDIKADCLRNLAIYRDDETKQVMNDYLKSESFKNLLVDAAVDGIRKLDDTYFINELQQTIETRVDELETRTIGSGLDTLAYIAREQEDTSQVREFLAGYVNHKNPRIKATALRALGTLGDVKARALLESFVPRGEMPSVVPRRRRFFSPAWAAKNALDKLNREQKFAPDEVIELREKIDELKKETEKTKGELEDLKKRFEAQQMAADSNDISAPADLNESSTEEFCDTPEFYSWASRPPMGWNSWDCYGPTVTEEEVKANAVYMAEHLKEFGWEYIVIDIRWFVKNTKVHGYNQRDPQYVLDEYGRYLPAENRFPSSAKGKGFKPLADYIHDKGLKFGIHIMRGVPVEAVKKRLPILACDANAADIYSTEMQCRWLRDNYTIVAGRVGSQEYYDSLFKLYASWGVDYVKVDDLSVPYHTQEIEMIRKAIDNCGQPIVLSTSPGPTPFENAEHISRHANLWRLTGDFWDNWNSLNKAFSKCSRWHKYIRAGSWPDSDMLALGRIGIRAERGNDRMSRFTNDEEITLMTLWCIARSPLMFGGDLPSNDEWTLKLITNPAVLSVNQDSENNKPLYEGDLTVWIADVPKSKDKYVAVFNRTDGEPKSVNVILEDIGFENVKVTDLWTGEDMGVYSRHFSPMINPHGAGLYRLKPKENKTSVDQL